VNDRRDINEWQIAGIKRVIASLDMPRRGSLAYYDILW
jgi:hypothetical protein